MRRFNNNRDLWYAEMPTAGGLRLFSEEMLSGRIVDALKWCCDRRGMRLYNYVILPDRTILIANTAWGTLFDVLQGFQKFTSKAIVRILRTGSKNLQRSWIMPVLNEAGRGRNLDYLSIWQGDPELISLLSREDIDAKVFFINQSPVKCGFVTRPEHFKNSSANPLNPRDGWLVEPTDRGI